MWLEEGELARGQKTGDGGTAGSDLCLSHMRFLERLKLIASQVTRHQKALYTDSQDPLTDYRAVMVCVHLETGQQEERDGGQLRPI